MSTRKLGEAFTHSTSAEPLIGIGAAPNTLRLAETAFGAPSFSLAGAGIMPNALRLAETAFKTALGPSFSPIMTQALFAGFTDIVSTGALGSSPILGDIDVDRIVENFSTLVGQDSANASLDRERVRQLWGSYIYIQVWVIVLLLLLGVMKFDQTASALLGIANMMTEWGGKSIASSARKIALENFDRACPIGSKIPPIINILI
jgi:hypothetical protein